jgi:enoyl-CoA hydratase/carnithine racemase
VVSETSVGYDAAFGIGRLVLSREHARNALDLEMIAALQEAIDALEAMPDIGVVTIVSTVPKVFVSGGEINAMRDLTQSDGLMFVEAGHALLRRLELSPLVFMAVIDGFALGGGTELALACDLVIASDAAVFGFPETGLGLFPGWGGTQRLPRAIGGIRSRELIFTGRRIGAREAFELGLVNQVVARHDLDEQVRALAQSVLASSPSAVAAAKAAMREGADLPLEAALKCERSSWVLHLDHPDRREGLTAFLERRPANFGPRSSGPDTDAAARFRLQ